MDSITRQKLKQLVQNQHWDAIYAFIALISDKWHNEEVKASDQFNTTWNQAYKEGKVKGLKEFIEGVEQLTLND